MNIPETPFKLRADLLQLAKSLLVEEYMVERQNRIEVCTTFHRQPDFSDMFFPSVEDVIEEARKLKNFVDNG